jgi:hypothetical protein
MKTATTNEQHQALAGGAPWPTMSPVPDRYAPCPKAIDGSGATRGRVAPMTFGTCNQPRRLGGPVT